MTREEQIKKVKDLIKNGLPVAQAIEEAGIKKYQYYNYRYRNIKSKPKQMKKLRSITVTELPSIPVMQESKEPFIVFGSTHQLSEIIRSLR
jgi:hypothetical protein